MDFRKIKIFDLAETIKNGDMQAKNVVRHSLKIIKKYNKNLNAFVQIRNENELLEEADLIDEKVKRGEYLGPLAGIPVGVKDIEDICGLVTTYGSILNKNDAPALQNSIVVQKLRDAGALIIGKTNTSEYAHKAITDNKLWGATINPWNRNYSPGGSSGGSAVAIASGMVPVAIGSDGGGSLRIPSAACRLSGFKPSTGVIATGDKKPPLCSPLIVKGPMARTIKEIKYVFDVIKGASNKDIYSYDILREKITCSTDISEVKAIWSPTMGFASVDNEVKNICENAINKLKKCGMQITNREEIFADDPNIHWKNLWSSGLANRLSRYRNSPEYYSMDESLRELINVGEKISAIEFCRALDASHEYNYILSDILDEADVLITPACAGLYPEADKGQMGKINGKETENWIQMEAVFNMTKSPVATIVVGDDMSQDMPVAIQIIGQPREDYKVLKIAHQIENIIKY